MATVLCVPSQSKAPESRMCGLVTCIPKQANSKRAGQVPRPVEPSVQLHASVPSLWTNTTMRLGALRSSTGAFTPQRVSRCAVCRPCTGRLVSVQARLGVVRVGQADAEEQPKPDEDEDYQLRSDLKSVARSMLEGKPLLREDEAEVREEMERERFFGRIAVLGLGVRVSAIVLYHLLMAFICSCMLLKALAKIPPRYTWPKPLLWRRQRCWGSASLAGAWYKRWTMQ